ncbi:MAG: YitT family protein [Corallococcus sp.]|nr:YitT family protein [Corallococcus sp.]MCM1359770.1 YitT family protein [Corallococcus sp.]MCM1395704.1 YitT family protein [Corallococcus sp.]
MSTVDKKLKNKKEVADAGINADGAAEVEQAAETQVNTESLPSVAVEENNVSKKFNKGAVWNNVRQYLIVFGAALATALSVEVFLLSSDVVIGGALGIASILDILLCTDASKWYFSAGVWLVALNVPIVIYCFVTFRKRFAVKTLLYVLFLAVTMIIFKVTHLSTHIENLMYGEANEKDKVIYVILGGALHGLSLPMLLSVNASTGGSDIVGIMVQKRSKKSSSVAMRVIMATDLVVVLVSSVVLGVVRNSVSQAIEMFIYSVAALFICEIVKESIFKGFSAAMELEITTEKPEEMAEALQQGLRHGTTAVKVIGGFSHQEKTMILCVVNRSQLTHARRIIRRVDENAFAYVENVKEVLGKGFANKENDLEDSEN